jgi:hypothetical protein
VISAITGCGVSRVELGAVGAFEPGDVAGVLDHRHLHAETDPEIGHPLLAGVAHGGDLALDAALAEAAGHQHRVHAARQSVPSRSISSESMYWISTRVPVCTPAWASASDRDL